MAVDSSIDLTGRQEDLCRINQKRSFLLCCLVYEESPSSFPSLSFLFVVLFKICFFFFFTFTVCNWRDQKITHVTYFSLGPPSSTFLGLSLCWDSSHAPPHPVPKEVLKFSPGRSSSAVCLSGVLSNSLQGVPALVGRLPCFTAAFPRLEQTSESPRGLTNTDLGR